MFNQELQCDKHHKRVHNHNARLSAAGGEERGQKHGDVAGSVC